MKWKIARLVWRIGGNYYMYGRMLLVLVASILSILGAATSQSIVVTIFAGALTLWTSYVLIVDITRLLKVAVNLHKSYKEDLLYSAVQCFFSYIKSLQKVGNAHSTKEKRQLERSLSILHISESTSLAFLEQMLHDAYTAFVRISKDQKVEELILKKYPFFEKLTLLKYEGVDFDILIQYNIQTLRLDLICDGSLAHPKILPTIMITL